MRRQQTYIAKSSSNSLKELNFVKRIGKKEVKSPRDQLLMKKIDVSSFKE